MHDLERHLDSSHQSQQPTLLQSLATPGIAPSTTVTTAHVVEWQFVQNGHDSVVPPSDRLSAVRQSRNMNHLYTTRREDARLTEINMSGYGLLLEHFDQEVRTRDSREQALREFSSTPQPTLLARQRDLQLKQQAMAEQTAACEAEFAAALQHITDHYATALHELETTHRSILRSINNEADRAISEVEQRREDSEWVVSSVLDDTAEDSPLREFEKFQSIINTTREEQLAHRQLLEEEYLGLSQERGWTVAEPEAVGPAFKTREQAREAFQGAIEAASRTLISIRKLMLPRLFLGFRSLIVFVVLTVLLAIPLFLLVDPTPFGIQGERLQTNWIVLSSGAGAIGSLLLSVILFSLGAMRQSDQFRQLEDFRSAAASALNQWEKLVSEDLKTETKRRSVKQRAIERERQQALDRYEQAHQQRISEINTLRNTRLQEERTRFQQESALLEEQRAQQVARLESDDREQSAQRTAQNHRELQQIEAEVQQLQSAYSRQLSQRWMELKSHWERESREFFQVVETVNQAAEVLNPAWDQLTPEAWQPAKQLPQGICFGRMQIDLEQWPAAISADMRLAPRTTQFQLPAEIPFPGLTSTLFQSSTPEARREAIAAMQTLMLRMLLQIPPGKLRFTLIDPIGLGESFGGFMHLADYDELMVTSRIWTEPGQIEARLADLTEHMENVFQTYLRNEFQTIEEYNAHAGEVAEPYHVLVISDFPAKFSEIAARRLVSIVNSGPRCGVYTLMNVDPGKQLPNNFDLSDLEPHMTGYEWRDGHVHAVESALAPWPIEVDQPPSPELFTRLVKMIGVASKDARRVEVSFDRITPPASEIWSHDSRHELSIPLGRAGATKLQQLRLGKGTSQHMLVAGKTGSGKSTFMHILVTNLALHYSPDQVNFYLIDFKKGVEFKDYASCQLPHARVIAIESDREFGVSTLQKLDEELQLRGELFRRAGVQDLAGYRNAHPDQPLPRLLLMVDEFQEFFIEDDKLSQTAALLLDRLVRQGRAFGMHVVLGSQTLGGAYSLARTTLGQVGVRVALQCSEADAHLILSEENTAARLLTRPGEAIYNDANGMIEGNHPFQIAWLSDQERRVALELLHQRATRAGLNCAAPVVFEGNLPSQLKTNEELHAVAQSCSQRAVPLSAPTLWLGDAVEIGPPTRLVFHAENGSHLLIVGQDREAALGILFASSLAIAAASAPAASEPALFVFDGNPADTEESQHWRALLEVLPTPSEYVSPRDASQALARLQVELDRRTADPTDAAPPLFVIVDHIAKFRELRKAEDDFGLGGFGSNLDDKPADPAKQFANLLKEGAAVGIHCLIWCDSYNNVERSFSRQMLKELELRVALQMNAADSSNLIDSPAAARLGTHRALLYREETGRLEKFRPYGLPTPEWIEEYVRLLKSGSSAEFATDLEEFNIL